MKLRFIMLFLIWGSFFSGVISQIIHLVKAGSDNGPGTLRYLNNQASAGDTIRCADSNVQVKISSGEPHINKSLYIEGDQPNTQNTRFSSDEFRVLEIEGNSSSIQVSLVNLDILNGLTNQVQSPPGGGTYIPSSMGYHFLEILLSKIEIVELNG